MKATEVLLTDIQTAAKHVRKQEGVEAPHTPYLLISLSHSLHISLSPYLLQALRSASQMCSRLREELASDNDASFRVIDPASFTAVVLIRFFKILFIYYFWGGVSQRHLQRL